MRFKAALLGILAVVVFLATQTHATEFSLVKTIDLYALVGDEGSIEVDVVGNELYLANWIQDKYFVIDPVTGTLVRSFGLSNGILMDNHGSEYNPTTGRILHARDGDMGGAPGYDAFFETDTNGVVTKGPYQLFVGSGYRSNDPEGLTVDPSTGRVWVSLEPGGGGPDGIFEINPNDGTVVNRLNVGPALALGFNPISRKLFFADQNGVIKEVAPDGSGLATVFDAGVGPIFGMAFTPTGDLVLLDFASSGIPLPSRLLLYDSSDDADDVFTTTAPVPNFIDIIHPTGSVHAYPNMIWPPNNKMVTVTLDGYVMDELSIARDAAGIGVSNAYLLINGSKIVLREGDTTNMLTEHGRFSITTQVKAEKGAVYEVELHAADTNPIENGGPNIGLVDSTSIRVPHDMSEGK